MSVAEVSDSTSLRFKNNGHVSAYKLLVVRDGELCYGSERDLYIILVYRLQCTNYQSIFFLWFYSTIT